MVRASLLRQKKHYRKEGFEIQQKNFRPSTHPFPVLIEKHSTWQNFNLKPDWFEERQQLVPLCPILWTLSSLNFSYLRIPEAILNFPIKFSLIWSDVHAVQLWRNCDIIN